MVRKRICNWGLYPEVETEFIETSNVSAIRDIIASQEHLIARGNGRCYGDASLADTTLSTLRLNRFLAFDADLGEIECESGVLLSDVLDVIVPKGYFLPVTPGTKYVTVGGAIAADVHGKNHHAVGSFSEHTIEVRLLQEDGSIVTCGPSQNPELFWTTCGGMGLTGVILSARFRLKAIETSYMRQAARKAKDLHSAMQLFEDTSNSTYSVAWIDCFAGGQSFGRSILITGEHASPSELPPSFVNNPLKRAGMRSLNLPVFMPKFIVNRWTAKVFNSAYYYRDPKQHRETIVHFDPFFYPLDGVLNWNRVYGRKGFLQYQFVLPKQDSYQGLTKILTKIRDCGEGSPLAVLKLLGNSRPESLMGFPLEGYTLALDFKVNQRVFDLLDSLDQIVVDYGGRLYLAKDARMSPETFRASYPKALRSCRFMSIQSKRLHGQ
jgi:decaprenylphospho-beta-D-ribofuranose 2-oxidase